MLLDVVVIPPLLDAVMFGDAPPLPPPAPPVPPPFVSSQPKAPTSNAEREQIR
ncbi:Hypothetical protein A7982_03095 [Minicystis rosea]|nr:Hypothetical protein A7982_03095 [Minicystis rosea]